MRPQFMNKRTNGNRQPAPKQPAEKVPLLNLKDLRNYLETYLQDKKDEILELNTECNGDTTFLYRTYCVEWAYERGNPKIRITVFKDLPSPYPEIISEQIRAYVRGKGIDAEYKFWSSYKAFKALDPVRVLRN
jgi:hypothetical protein